MKTVIVISACAGITLALGLIHIALGILALPIMYEVSASLLSE